MFHLNILYMIMYAKLYVYVMVYSIHLPVSGHGLCHVLATMNSAAVNVGVQLRP